MKNVGFIVLVAAMIVVERAYGEIAFTRMVGLLFVVANLAALFVAELPLRLGGEVVHTFTGWSKGILILPFTALGVLVVVYAADVTCWSAKYKHLCA